MQIESCVVTLKIKILINSVSQMRGRIILWVVYLLSLGGLVWQTEIITTTFRMKIWT